MKNSPLIASLLVTTALGAAWTLRSEPAAPASPRAEVQDSAAVAQDLRAGTTFAIDASHSTVLFRVQHLGAGPFWGRFNKVSGEFRIDDAALGDSFVRAKIPVASVDTNSAGRDKHLRGPDFFNSEEHPELSFESSKVEKAGAKYRITGKLSMRGESHEIVAMAEHVGTKKLSKRFGLRSGYEVEFTIDRTKFGMDYMAKGGGLGKSVRVVLGVEGVPAKAK